MKVAIVGDCGLVGSRLLELWRRSGLHPARAVVQTPAGLARATRFTVELRRAEALDAAALAQAFAGCEVVVHDAADDEHAIADTVEPVYRAARAAGVRRIVYLSTALVHGPNPPPGTTEATPLRDDQPFANSNARVRAERCLGRLAADGKVETVVLRPGIVFGPKSLRVLELADALPVGRAYWIDGGRAMCNSIYIDNLAHAIEHAIATPGVSGEAFLVGDEERVTWREFYLGVARALGFGERAFHEARPAAAPHRRGTGWVSTLRRAILARLPVREKPALPPADPWALPPELCEYVASAEMTALFRCQEKLSHAKATQRLGYRPPVSFASGLEHTGRWLREIGYADSIPDGGGFR